MYLRDAKWIVPLLAAAAEGKTLQFRYSEACGWEDVNPHAECRFGRGADNYRIKSEIPEWKQKLLDARKAGKEIQYRTRGAACAHFWATLYGEIVGSDSTVYRIKPEPKWRPWREEEVPIGALWRLKGKTRCSVIRLSPDGAWTMWTGPAAEKYEWCWPHEQFNPAAWKQCGVTEES